MCGIVGIAFNHKHFDLVPKLTDLLSHRGPDSAGVWQDQNVALGHRRLAIIDLSVSGHQPMLSSSGRYVITYNGEIYNFLNLKAELEQLHYKFISHSDTEVLLAAVEAWGIESALQKLNGMFAFGLWDRQEKVLYLARDRFGEKPLYYGLINGAVVFASGLKALRTYPDFKGEINTQALELFLRYAYIPAPQSIYKNIYKLPPGHYLKITQDLTCESKIYWSATTAALLAYQQPFQGSEIEALKQLESLLKSSVTLRMVSDVALGAFLSGGIDSSLIVALMQNNSQQKIKTFSIGFNQATYDEAPFAKKVAAHLGTEHTEFYVNEADALEVIPKLAQIYDEPFADASQIPTYLVAKLAKTQVTVALSGDAGDELFGGYNRYFLGYGIYQKLNKLPRVLQKILTKIIFAYPPETWNRYLDKILAKKIAGPGDKLWKLASTLQQDDQGFGFYDRIISQNHEAHKFVYTPAINKLHFDFLEQLSYQENMMLFDVLTYLPGDILTKVDRAAMAVSLETRIPFLDPAVFSFAWSLPLNYKIRKQQGKYLLRQLLYRYVPKDLIERPKMGFGIPMDDWLRGVLKDWAQHLLDPQKMQAQGYLNVAQVQKVWHEHLHRKCNLGYLLWNILMFQLWLDEN